MKTNMPELLAVDDDPMVLRSLGAALEGDYKLHTASNAAECLAVLNSERILLVILDLGLPDMNGLELLKKVKEANPDMEVIVLTGNSSLESGIEAMKLGACDYLVKPFDVEKLGLVVKNAVEKSGLRHEVRYHRSISVEKERKLIGQSRSMLELANLIKKVAENNATVLITGESGTGKEIVAREIWRQSERKDRPFVPVNCGAIPAELMESELFGHEKGAFTSASYHRTGKFELANHGTIFLDEISAMPLTLQVKLLRVLQERTVERVGGMKQIPIDVRVIAATNLDLGEMVKSGKFREDLFYRLNIILLSVPPLRERRHDIPLLAKYFLNIYNHELHRRVKEIPMEVLNFFHTYDWRGNVRELENVIQRLLVVAKNNTISVSDLPVEITKQGDSKYYILEDGVSYDEAMTRFEKNYIRNALSKANNNRNVAADALGVHRNTLTNRMKALGITIPEDEKPPIPDESAPAQEDASPA
ncbi:MAG: sigma-54-dependent Fis family transcriptional regulator [Planctomycetes bacterium]|nr:sigma-54-dependent Fis family transcriptional regulator [Planctomycetota bacterium]